jgi:hypothetical protein
MNKRMNRCSLFVNGYLAVLVITVVGCTQETSHGIVNGTVTLDGATLAEGLIRFDPQDGQTATADAPIKDGAFSARVPVGPKRISISAPKVVGKRKMYETADSPTVDVIEELLPARYNSESDLTLTVSAGKQPASFNLQSEK